ncbi:putative phosphoketolase [Pilimelia anulata]|uniref:Putative phosphoketolase n=1 Tax=Pilimelia anulata TaxID=53371 RepID=A0A8J3B9A1_9ACTN|nr:putative phosphoketolase [Pilimelia anulata]
MTYVSVALLHARTAPVPGRLLTVGDVKERPAGHWGTVPGTALTMAHVGLAAAATSWSVVPVIGAAHAGLTQTALAWLTGHLARIDPRYSVDRHGLAALAEGWPEVNRLGSEVHPCLPAGDYVGGWLGGALAFAQGASSRTAGRLLVPILGDGECETPTTAAAWLAQQALPTAAVVPIVHLNGRRMGSPSLLGVMTDYEVAAYLGGHGWEAHLVDADRADIHERFAAALTAGFADTAAGSRRVAVVLRCRKGWSGPVGEHKTPITNPAGDPDQLAYLNQWLNSYAAGQLFDTEGHPTGLLADALAAASYERLPVPPRAEVAVRRPHTRAARATGGGFGDHVGGVLRAHAAAGQLRVFSPDELASNRLPEIANRPWAVEVLAEEVLAGWLAGWTAAGNTGVLISYEAFAPLTLTTLVGQLRQRRMADVELPSINLLLTSYGWHNVHSHADPSLTTALAAMDDPAVRLFTPTTPAHTGRVLDEALASTGRVNVIVAGKHPLPARQPYAETAEHADGFTVHRPPTLTETQLTLVAIGDLPASNVAAAAPALAATGVSATVIEVQELTALRRVALRQRLATAGPTLLVTLGHPAAVWGLLAEAAPPRARVLGWREPPHPMNHTDLAAYAGITACGITEAAHALLAEGSQT